MPSTLKAFAKLILLFSALLFLSPHSSLAQSKAAAIENLYDFGTIKKGVKVKHTFTLKNVGSSDLIIKDVEVMKVAPSFSVKGSIPPGQEEKITLTLDTEDLRGEIRAGILVHTNDTDNPEIKFILHGRVVSLIDIIPYPAFFIQAFKGESAKKTLTIVNFDNKPLFIKNLSYKSNRFNAYLVPIKKGKEYNLTVEINPNANVGKSSEFIKLSTNKSAMPQLAIPVNIFVKDIVFSFPDAINYGVLQLQKLQQNPALLQYHIYNILIKRKPSLGNDFQIQVEHSIPFVSIQKTPESDSDTYRLEVFLELGKMKPGKIDTFIRVKTNDKEVPELKIPVVGEVL